MDKRSNPFNLSLSPFSSSSPDNGLSSVSFFYFIRVQRGRETRCDSPYQLRTQYAFEGHAVLSDLYVMILELPTIRPTTNKRNESNIQHKNQTKLVNMCNPMHSAIPQMESSIQSEHG
jgi:hypothetical protein